MTEKLTRAPFLGWPAALALREVLREAEVEMRFVGGCVRDALLERPIIEADLATPARPEQVMDLFKRAGWRVIPTGLKHGTVTVRHDHTSFEITTLRRDLQCDGRHAKVEFTHQWEEDAARRDFTINAMYIDFSGNVYDYHNGSKDLKKKLLRFIGNPLERIHEDALRMLRLFRFNAQLGFTPDEAALAACEELAGNVTRLSGERIHQEMRKLLICPCPDTALEHMRKRGFISLIFGGDVDIMLSSHLLHEQELQLGPDCMTRLAYMLSLCSSAEARRERIRFLKSRWVLSNAEVDQLQRLLLSPYPITHESSKALQKKALRVLGKEHYIQLLLIAWATEAREHDADTRDMLEGYQQMKQFADSWPIPTFPLGGEDLMAKGIPAGIELGQKLKELEKLWESSDYQASKAELLARL